MNIRDKVAVIGAGCSKFGENYDMSAEDMIVTAASEAYADARIAKSRPPGSAPSVRRWPATRLPTR